MKLNEHPPGATPLDQDDIDQLKLKYITTLEELNRWEQENISFALDWLARRRNKKEVLNEEFILKLHEKMFGKVWGWAGKFRRSEKNIGVPWVNVPVAVRTLVDDAKAWIEFNSFTHDEIASRFHHQLVLIHPFSNGNGRHSREITDALLKDVLGRDVFTWGSGNLIDKGEVRERYIAALKAADQNNYQPLLHFVRS